MTKEALEAALSKWETLVQVFGIICAVGLAGEVAFGLRAWRVNKELTEVLNAENRSREAEIARLKKEAEEVRIRAAEAVMHSANAESQVAAANRGWEEAKAGTAKALTDFEKQKERTALAEKEVLLLKERMAPRHISPDKRLVLLPMLRVGSKGKVDLSAPLGDAEAANYAQDMAMLLREAGWETNYEIGNSVLRGNGVFILVKDPNAPPVGALQLQTAFTTAGIKMEGQKMESMPSDSIQIFVGGKP
jgi:hypothetical protein